MNSSTFLRGHLYQNDPSQINVQSKALKTVDFCRPIVRQLYRYYFTHLCVRPSKLIQTIFSTAGELINVCNLAKWLIN
jgi:hypothetical protein